MYETAERSGKDVKGGGGGVPWVQIMEKEFECLVALVTTVRLNVQCEFYCTAGTIATAVNIFSKITIMTPL